MKADSEAPAADSLSVSMESASFQYTPYLAMMLDKDKMTQVVNHFQSRNANAYHSAPKVTLFSGQAARVVDESRRPFVVGVEYVKGELAAATQPKIAVLPEGARIEVQPRVIDSETLDLKCRLTLSFIDGVIEARLPGQDITVQAPRATSRTVTARCRVKRGETLLIAPLTGWSGKDKKDGFFYYAITTDWFPDPIAVGE